MNNFATAVFIFLAAAFTGFSLTLSLFGKGNIFMNSLFITAGFIFFALALKDFFAAHAKYIVNKLSKNDTKQNEGCKPSG